MRGLIFVNVGTPASCTKADVEKFIGDMLSDPLVMGKPEWFSNVLARKVIAPLSCGKSVEKYRQIWGEDIHNVSPLLCNMIKLAEKFEQQTSIPTEICLRYGHPDFADAIKRLEEKCNTLHEVIIMPLFPHYAQSTTKTAVDEISRSYLKECHSYRLRIINPYYNHPAYIRALAENAKPYLNEDIDKLVFDYHSLPIKQVEEGWKLGKEFDYMYQLKETNRLLAIELGIPSKEILLFFSSHRGNDWLKPFLSTDIADLPKLGWKKIAVMAPGFLSDNMETLYDINIEARDLFMNAGGESFTFIPSLNDKDVWINAITEIIN